MKISTLPTNSDHPHIFTFANLHIIILLLFITGCRSTRYIPLTTQETHRDTIHLTTIRHDSIHLHDSIYILQEQKGDTIRITTTKYQYRDRTKMIHDTILRVTRDTIRQPIPITTTDTTPQRHTLRERITAWIILILFIAFAIYAIRKTTS